MNRTRGNYGDYYGTDKEMEDWLAGGPKNQRNHNTDVTRIITIKGLKDEVLDTLLKNADKIGLTYITAFSNKMVGTKLDRSITGVINIISASDIGEWIKYIEDSTGVAVEISATPVALISISDDIMKG